MRQAYRAERDALAGRVAFLEEELKTARVACGCLPSGARPVTSQYPAPRSDAFDVDVGDSLRNLNSSGDAESQMCFV